MNPKIKENTIILDLHYQFLNKHDKRITQLLGDLNILLGKQFGNGNCGSFPFGNVLKFYCSSNLILDRAKKVVEQELNERKIKFEWKEEV